MSLDGGGASFSFLWCATGWWALSLPFFLKDADQAAGVEDGGQLDLAPFSLDGGGRRWRVVVHELKSLGCSPGRWATADGYIPSLGMGVYFDSFKASARWGSSSSGSCLRSFSTMVAGDEDFWHLRVAEILGASL